MSGPIFDHDRLDVYRLAVEYTAEAFRMAQRLSGLHRHARDQWLRAGQSIPLNIAEGNGKRSATDRARFLDIARGSALECAAIQDVLTASGGLDAESNLGMKRKLQRIVSMLTRMAMKPDGVAEAETGYRVGGADDYEDGDEDGDGDGDDYDYEHEHEHEQKKGDESGGGRAAQS